MPAPVSRLKKSEIVWLSKNYCKHHHTYLDHYNCYLEENPNKGRIGFFDIETSNLKANYGVILGYCILDGESGEIIGRHLTKKEVRSHSTDKALVREIVSNLKLFDRVVTYYGTKFDLPYVRTRALHHNIDFPAYGEIIHTDLYYIIRHKFNLNRNSLAVATEFLLGDTNKTRVEGKHWIRGLQGHEDSLRYIQEHCEYDVEDTRRLYEKVIGFKRPSDLSA